MHTRSILKSATVVVAGLLLAPACSERSSPEAEPKAAPGPASAAAPKSVPVAAPTAAATAAATAAREAPGSDPGVDRVSALPPKWIGIEGVRACTGQLLGMFVCTPPERPAACTEQAWAQLTALTGRDAVTPCALEPDLMACTISARKDGDMRCFPDVRPAACTDAMWQRVQDVRIISMCRDVPPEVAPGSGP